MDNIEEKEILTKEEVENRRKEVMREHLIDIFDGSSILYEIYKSRNWLDKIFTDPILLMDTKASYTTTQLAAICEVPVYMINNRRRELIEYLQPEVFGEENNKTFKHNYISSFKMKMVIGLTGDGGEFSVPNLKELIFSGGKLGQRINQNSNTNNNTTNNEQLLQILNMMKRFEKFQDMIESDEFFREIEKKVASTTERLLLSSRDDTGVNESKRLYDFICSNNGSLTEKEKSLEDFEDILSRYPEQLHMIHMYKTAAEERITRIRQDEKEFTIKNVKLKLADLLDNYNNAQNDTQRENVRSQIMNLSNDHPDLNFEIRMWLATTSKQNTKKGFLSKLFSK